MRHRGFTLLELIVVLAIFGVFAAMAYGGLNHVLNSRKSLEASLDRNGEWQKAFQRLRGDFLLAMPRPASNGFGQVQPALQFDDYEARLEFTRAGWRNPLYLPRPSLERAVYRYDRDSKSLVRDTWRVLDRASDNDPVSLTVLTKLDEVVWRFLDSSKDWRTKWPPAATGQGAAAPSAMPCAVEVTLRAKDFGEVRWLFRIGVEEAAVVAATPPAGGTPGTAPPVVTGGKTTGSCR